MGWGKKEERRPPRFPPQNPNPRPPRHPPRKGPGGRPRKREIPIEHPRGGNGQGEDRDLVPLYPERIPDTPTRIPWEDIYPEKNPEEEWAEHILKFYNFRDPYNEGAIPKHFDFLTNILLGDMDDWPWWNIPGNNDDLFKPTSPSLHQQEEDLKEYYRSSNTGQPPASRGKKKNTRGVQLGSKRKRGK